MLVLFDLDGTLIDSRRGIEHSLRMTLEQSGINVGEDHDFTPVIGTSLWKIFEHYLNTDDQAVLDGAVARYRHIYRDGPMFEYDIYDGVPDMLTALRHAGHRVVVATAKAHEYAREVIATSSIASHINHVYGSELDGRNVEKRDLLKHILDEEGVQAEDMIMVGDRHHDVDGAEHNGLRSIGVLYGYGSADELSNATRCVDHPREIASTINAGF